MEVVLFRHGIAIDRADPTCPVEAERFLTPKGVQRTREAARGLRAMGVRGQVVVSSPYRRAVQTAELALEALGLEREILVQREDILPMTPPQKLLGHLAEFQGRDLLVVGHAPHLDEFLALAVGATRSFTVLKKAGAAKLVFHDPSYRRAELEWLVSSRALRELGA